MIYSLILLGVLVVCICISAKRQADIEFRLKYKTVIKDFCAWADRLDKNRDLTEAMESDDLYNKVTPNLKPVDFKKVYDRILTSQESDDLY